MKNFTVAASIAVALMSTTAVSAAELEVTHWWTSAGEAASIAEFARIFEEETGHTWVDSALGGSGTGANPVILSRIIGGDPMGATQLNTGREAEELIAAGLMRDLTDIADEVGLREFFVDETLLEPCTYEGRIYCFPINIHSWDWLWLSTAAYEEIGQPVPTNWNEYVESWPALEEAGILPFGLATGWPIDGVPGVLLAGIGGSDLVLAINRDKDADAVRSPEFREVAEALDDLRGVISADMMVPSFGDVGNQLLAGEAAGNIHGDWLQGDLQVAGGVPGEDYECIPGLGLNDQLSGGGDSFYFPVLPEGTDPEVIEAQTELARIIVSKQAQLAFNLKKGSMPIRTDIDLSQANACMTKAIELLDNGLLPSGETTLTSDTMAQLNDLTKEFIDNDSISVDDYIERYASLIESAD